MKLDWLIVAIIAALVSACAAPQTERLLQQHGSLPEKAAVRDTVFFAQRTKECGPAALAMALDQSGVSVAPDDLVAEVYTPSRGGSLAPDILAAARRHGRVAYPVGSLKALLDELAGGRPVLVLQNLALDWAPQWHFAVAVGYDFVAPSVTLHSGRTRFRETPMSTFERTWERSGYWGLVLLRPGRFPANPDEPTYIRAVAGVERAGQARVAERSYRAALARWPHSLSAAMGLGNTLYRLGDRKAAARAFEDAVARHPDSPDPYNNLAHVLMELGDLQAAEIAARHAVAIGGVRKDIYRETLTAILSRR